VFGAGLPAAVLKGVSLVTASRRATVRATLDVDVYVAGKMRTHGDDADTGPRPAEAGADLGSIPGVGAGRTLTVDHAAVLTGRRGPRRRVPPLAVGLVGLILVPAALAGRLGDRGEAAAAASGDTVVSVADPAGSRTTQAMPSAATPPPRFARLDGLDLHLPNEEVLLVGFHEASYDDALAFTPVGDAVANENRTKFTAPATDPDGPAYVVLSSRGRANPATSAVDLVMRDNTPVLSMVTGTVTDVRPYHLYNQHPDTRIEIRPDDRPDLRVVVIHVTDVAVAVGDHLEAGVDRIAGGPNRFPFASHIDRYFEQDRWPHVHIEVKGTA
jgi:hypothetical protein